MFGAASRSREAQQRGWSLRKALLAVGQSRTRRVMFPTADVRAKRGQIAFLEAKTSCDTLATQQAICQQFHWLLSSQIHFRRTERAS